MYVVYGVVAGCVGATPTHTHRAESGHVPSHDPRAGCRTAPGPPPPFYSLSPLVHLSRDLKGCVTACTRFTSVRPQYYPTALVAITERPRTEQWMAPKGRECSMTYYRQQREN
eukprot:2639355-Prymnesium_polylepis.1